MPVAVLAAAKQKRRRMARLQEKAAAKNAQASYKSHESTLLDVFRRHDRDGNGMLDKTEMLTLLNEVAPPAEEDDVDFVFEELRKAGKVRDGDDKISFEAMGPACALWIDCAKDLDRDGADLVVETPPPAYVPRGLMSPASTGSNLTPRHVRLDGGGDTGTASAATGQLTGAALHQAQLPTPPPRMSPLATRPATSVLPALPGRVGPVLPPVGGKRETVALASPLAAPPLPLSSSSSSPAPSPLGERHRPVPASPRTPSGLGAAAAGPSDSAGAVERSGSPSGRPSPGPNRRFSSAEHASKYMEKADLRASAALSRAEEEASKLADKLAKSASASAGTGAAPRRGSLAVLASAATKVVTRLGGGGKEGKKEAKKDPLQDPAFILRAQELMKNEMMINTFSVFDKDGSGSISIEELRNVISMLQLAPTKGEAEDMLRELDINKDGAVDMWEFCVYVQKQKDEGKTREEAEVIENAFAQTLLADDEGFVTVDELRKLFTYQTAEQTDALSEKEFSEFCNMFGIGGASSRIPLDVIKRHPCWEEAKVEM